MTVDGFCDPRFAKVADALEQAITDGEECGAAIAVNIDGELIVDIWGGHTDAARTTAWSADTIVNVWSSTKNVTALAGLMLIDRGLITPETPVAQVWPEFGAAGKQRIEFRHLLTHSSGLSGWEQPVTAEDVLDWDRSTAMLAAQAPWWEPGSATGYHALTHGHLIGEVLRRLTGSSLREFVAAEIAGPLGADFQIGARPEDTGRIAEIIPAADPFEGLPAMDQWTEQMVKTFTGPAPAISVPPTGTPTPAHSPRSCRQSRWAARWAGSPCWPPRRSNGSSRPRSRGPIWCWPDISSGWGWGSLCPVRPSGTSRTAKSVSGAAGVDRGRR